jgi:hypothetical protein
MGINDEYSRDAYNYELAYDSDDSSSEPDPLHPEDWQDWYSEQILDAWMTIRQFTNENYIKLDVTYPQFVDFVMDSSSYNCGTGVENVVNLQMWNSIKSIQVIKEYVSKDAFLSWVDSNINYD